MGCKVNDRKLFLPTRSRQPWPLTLILIGAIYWLITMHLCSFRAKGPRVVKYLNGNRSYPQVQYDLDLWPFYTKIKGIIYLPRSIHLQSLRADSPWVVKLLIGNGFTYKATSSKWPWSLTTKIKKGHLLFKTNALTKFEGQRPMACQGIDWKPFLPTRSPLTP
jgi:hypothetical protein